MKDFYSHQLKNYCETMKYTNVSHQLTMDAQVSSSIINVKMDQNGMKDFYSQLKKYCETMKYTNVSHQLTMDVQVSSSMM